MGLCWAVGVHGMGLVCAVRRAVRGVRAMRGQRGAGSAAGSPASQQPRGAGQLVQAALGSHSSACLASRMWTPQWYISGSSESCLHFSSLCLLLVSAACVHTQSAHY